MSRVPIVWRNFTHSPRRLATSVAGIAFAVLLMFTEVGFLHGLYDSQVELVNHLNADLIITNRLKHTMVQLKPFARRRLYQATTIPGVKAAYPLYIHLERPVWKSPTNRKLYPIRVLAFRPEDPVFVNPTIVAHAAALQMPDTVLMDAQSKSYFGDRHAGVVTELSGKAIRVVDTFRLGTDFVNGGTLIMSDRNFLKFVASGHERDTLLGKVEIGVVHVVPGIEPATVAAALRQALPDDVAVYTRAEYLAHELRYWQEHTAIGPIYVLGAAMGFVIGVIICYQILYTDVVDHLPQFATMKAIGYHNRFLVGVVFQQALGLACLGFAPGLVLSSVFYSLLAHGTGLLMRLTVPRVSLIFILTVVMCIFAGSLAARKVFAADPAEVF